MVLIKTAKSEFEKKCKEIFLCYSLDNLFVTPHKFKACHDVENQTLQYSREDDANFPKGNIIFVNTLGKIFAKVNEKAFIEKLEKKNIIAKTDDTYETIIAEIVPVRLEIVKN